MKPEAIARAEHVLGARAESWSAVAERGYSNNERWLARFADGRTAFVKAAVDEATTRWLRTELLIYESVRGDFLPRLLGWSESPLPVLVLEDLSRDSFWPPPWSRTAVAAVLGALDEVAATPAPERLPRLEDAGYQLEGWRHVAEDVEPFLALGLCSRGWLTAALPTLLAASDEAVLGGAALVHCDVRSDNLCIRGSRALLFDWNHATVGNALFDVAFWLPSLAMEGGPQPEEIAPQGTAELAALVAGFFASRAGLPPPPTAPRVRSVQLAQLEVALPWAVRALGLPQLGGG